MSVKTNKSEENNLPDKILSSIADYVFDYEIQSSEAIQTARICLADSLGCAILALQYTDCTKLLGPVVPGTTVPGGSRIPGTSFILDPILAAFNIGMMIRWLDYNDTWLASEWGHPSDNLGGLLALCDFLSQQRSKDLMPSLTVKDLIKGMIKAHEIQGEFAILNSFNRVGFDHVIFVKVATSAIATYLWGGSKKDVINAVSNAWVDNCSLRTYRHTPNTGSRKSWAAGDATSRGVFFAMIASKGEMGYPSVLSAKKWGLYDVLFQGKPFEFERPFTTYVMENILFKVSYPAEFHGQTAVECAIKLHPLVKNKIDEIDSILIETQEAAIRIIDKKGPLKNPADRDHCLQYMIAIGLLKGTLSADDYEETASKDTNIDKLREKMQVVELKKYSQDYLAPEKRSIPNAITIKFKDGSLSPRIETEYPLGHRMRRKESIPLLFEKFASNLKTHFSFQKVKELTELFQDQERLFAMPVHSLIDSFDQKAHHPISRR